MVGCKPRIEVIVKMPKKCRDGEGGPVGAGGGEVSVDVNQELKLL